MSDNRPARWVRRADGSAVLTTADGYEIGELAPDDVAELRTLLLVPSPPEPNGESDLLPKGITCGDCGVTMDTGDLVERMARYIERRRQATPSPSPSGDLRDLPEWAQELVEAIEGLRFYAKGVSHPVAHRVVDAFDAARSAGALR